MIFVEGEIEIDRMEQNPEFNGYREGDFFKAFNEITYKIIDKVVMFDSVMTTYTTIYKVTSELTEQDRALLNLL